MQRTLLPLLPLFALLSFPSAPLLGQEDHFVVTLEADAAPLQAAVDQPLRDPHVLAAPDGWYYLTGTSAAGDYRTSNEGIGLWRSKDLQSWESLGQIWTVSQDTFWRRSGHAYAGASYTQPSKAMLAPEIHFFKGDYYVVFGMNYGGIGLLKSKRPEGPYRHWSKLREAGSDPSLFFEGKIAYLSWGGGWVARLSKDLTYLDERPHHLISELFPPNGWQNGGNTAEVGQYGSHLIKIDDRYCLVASDRHWRMGTHTEDMFVAVSAGDIYGPYYRRYLAIPHAAHGSIFQGHDKEWYACVSGDPSDTYAVLTHQPGIVPLELYQPLQASYQGVRPKGEVILSASSIGSLQPASGLEDEWLREPSICVGHDSAFYLVATRAYGWKIPKGGIEIWRSEDLAHWESLGEVWNFEENGSWHTDYIHRNQKGINQPCRQMSAPRIAYVKGTYLITLSFDCGIIGLLKSSTGKPEGPYIDPASGPVAAGSKAVVFEDNSNAFLLWGNGQIAKLSNDFSKLQFTPQELRAQDGALIGYECPGLIRYKGKYMLTMADWHGDHNGTYDLMYAVADRMFGPYQLRRFGLPHAGGGQLFQAVDGRLFVTFYGNDQTAPFHMRVGILEVDMDDQFQLYIKADRHPAQASNH